MPITNDNLSQVRHALLEWDPSQIILSQKESLALQNLWAEIKAVESVAAWKSLSALSGQLIEALLRQRLLIQGHYTFRVLSGQTLHPLIEMGRAVGILPNFDDPPTGTTSISTARLLRNWSSHSSLWHEHPTELRATQSLVLAICTIEGLFPSLRPRFIKPPSHASTDWWLAQWHQVGPGNLLNFLKSSDSAELIKFVKNSSQEFYTHVIRHGSTSSLEYLLQLSFDYQLDQDELRNSLTSNFQSVIRNSAQSRFRNLVELLWRLRILGLKAHANSFAILLPFDEHLFQRLLEGRSSAWVARYLAECFAAEPDVFKATAGDLGRMKGVVASFWKRFEIYSGNILNFANILANLPYQLRIAILERADVDQLCEWISESEPSKSVNLLASVNDRILQRAPQLTHLRNEILEKLLHKIKNSSPIELSTIPLRLTRFKLNNDSAGIKVIEEVLDVAAQSFEAWGHIQRILWDSYAFFPKSEINAAKKAAHILATCTTEVPFWNRLCLVGMTDLAAMPCATFGANEIDRDTFLKNAVNPAVSRYDRFLASLAYWRECQTHNLSFPVELAVPLQQLYSETEVTREGPSAKLLESIEELLRIVTAM
jgi:hypothetical protein